MKNTVGILDVATNLLYLAPNGSKSTAEAKGALRDFVGNRKVKEFYSDNAGELIKAAKAFGWIHPTSTPYRHESNAKAQRGGGKIKQGTRATLLGAGLPPKWWPYPGKGS